MNNKLNIFSSLGVVSSLLAIGLWISFLLNNPYKNQDSGVIGYIIVGLMLALSGTALWSSLYGRYAMLFTIFLLSFIPVGVYLLLTPSIYLWIGIANIGYLLSAIGLYIVDKK